MRLLVGPDHRLVLPASALFGAAFLVGCDVVARTVMAPIELPVGVITALIGGPFFLWLLVREDHERNAMCKSMATDRIVLALRGRSADSREDSAALQRREHAIISLIPAVTEMLFAIGAGPQVVAVSSFDRIRPRCRSCRASARCSIRTSNASSRCSPISSSSTPARRICASSSNARKIPIFVYSHAGLADIPRRSATSARASATQRAADDLERSTARCASMRFASASPAGRGRAR